MTKTSRIQLSYTWIVPVRGHLDSTKRLMVGDVHIGGGSRLRKLERSRWCNPLKVAVHAVHDWFVAIQEFAESIVFPGGFTCSDTGMDVIGRATP